MNLYLVQPADPYGPNKFLPLAVSYQWLYAQNPDWRVADVVIEKLPIGRYVEGMEEPHLVAMSCYVWNWEYNKALAKEIKSKFPKSVIVVGGPQVPRLDIELFCKFPYFDLAVHGEGELAFKELLEHFADRTFEDIRGVQTRNRLPDRVNRLKDISQIPSPILSGFYEQIMQKYPKDTMWQVTLETMRGCPYQCSYCDMGDSSWDRLLKFDMDRVRAEIEWIGKNKIEYVSVCDSNWGLFDRDVEITQLVIDTKLKYGFPKVWDVTMAKRSNKRNVEMALLDKAANTRLFKGVTFALQSLNGKSLHATRRFNLPETELKQYLDLYRQENIPTYSELIWPLPEETLESLKSGIQRLIDMGQDDFLMIHPLVLTPNAPISEKLSVQKFGIKTKTVPLDTYYLDISKLSDHVFEMTEAVYETSTASYEEVISGFMFSYVLITFYYYGWAHYLSKYICHKFAMSEVQFFEQLEAWIIRNPSTLVGNEYVATRNSLVDVFEGRALWGRQVLGEQDILWEYKSASSVVFQQNREKLQRELEAFISECYSKSLVESVAVGLSMCCDHSTVYPSVVMTNGELAHEMFGINCKELLIDHEPREFPKSEKDFFSLAYHYQRKNRFWRNTVKGFNCGNLKVSF